MLLTHVEMAVFVAKLGTLRVLVLYKHDFPFDQRKNKGVSYHGGTCTHVVRLNILLMCVIENMGFLHDINYIMASFHLLIML